MNLLIMLVALFLPTQLQGQDFLESTEVKVKDVMIRYNGPKSIAESRLRGYISTQKKLLVEFGSFLKSPLVRYRT